MVVFFFFCEEYSFGLFFRGVKIIGRSNPSSSRASSSSSRQSRCGGGGASSSFDPTTFIRASASTQTSSSSPLRWSSFSFSLYSKSGGFGDGVSPSIQKSPRRCRRTKTPHALYVLLCRLFFFFSLLSSETLCLYICSLSQSSRL